MNTQQRRVKWRVVGERTLVVLAGVLFLAVLLFEFGYPHYDFAFFYYAFDVVRGSHDPSLLYDIAHEQAWLSQLGDGEVVRTFGRFDQYVYPPQFAVLLCGFSALPYHLATTLWETCSVIGYLTGVFWMIQMACPKHGERTRWVLFGIGLIQFPYLWDFLIGNSNWLIFFLITLAFRLNYQSRHSWVAGIPLGLAIVFKVTPVILLFYYLLRRDWKMPLGAIVTSIVATLISAIVVGWGTLWQYATSLGGLSAQSMKNGGAPYNSSIYGVAQLWHIHPYVRVFSHSVNAVYFLFLAGLVLVVGITVAARKIDTRSDVAISVLCMLLASPLIEGPHLVLALIPLLMVIGMGGFHRPDRYLLRGSHWLWMAGFLFVIVILSPIGWLLRTILPIEYTVVLLVLLLMSLVQVTRRQHLV